MTIENTKEKNLNQVEFECIWLLKKGFSLHDMWIFMWRFSSYNGGVTWI